jgi:hypothetical protein
MTSLTLFGFPSWLAVGRFAWKNASAILAAALCAGVVAIVFLTSERGERCLPVGVCEAAPDVFGLRAARRNDAAGAAGATAAPAHAAASRRTNAVLATRAAGAVFRAPHDPRGGSFSAAAHAAGCDGGAGGAGGVASAATGERFATLRRVTDATLQTATAAGLPAWLHSLVSTTAREAAETAAAAAVSAPAPADAAPQLPFARAVFEDVALAAAPAAPPPPACGAPLVVGADTAASALLSIVRQFSPAAVAETCFQRNKEIGQTGIRVDALFDDGTHAIAVRAAAGSGEDEDDSAAAARRLWAQCRVFLITVPRNLADASEELVRRYILLHITRMLARGGAADGGA